MHADHNLGVTVLVAGFPKLLMAASSPPEVRKLNLRRKGAPRSSQPATAEVPGVVRLGMLTPRSAPDPQLSSDIESNENSFWDDVDQIPEYRGKAQTDAQVWEDCECTFTHASIFFRFFAHPARSTLFSCRV